MFENRDSLAQNPMIPIEKLGEDYVRRLYESGMTLAEISQETGRPVSNVRTVLKSMGSVKKGSQKKANGKTSNSKKTAKNVKKPSSPSKDKSDEYIKLLYESGLSLSEVARDTNHTPKNIRETLVKMGVTIRTPGRPRKNGSKPKKNADDDADGKIAEKILKTAKPKTKKEITRLYGQGMNVRMITSKTKTTSYVVRNTLRNAGFENCLKGAEPNDQTRKLIYQLLLYGVLPENIADALEIPKSYITMVQRTMDKKECMTQQDDDVFKNLIEELANEQAC